MLTRTHTRTFDRFLLDGSLPDRILVHDVTPDGHATPLFAVVADHGWASRILAGDCYLRDANDLAYAVGELLDIPVEECVAPECSSRAHPTPAETGGVVVGEEDT